MAMPHAAANAVYDTVRERAPELVRPDAATLDVTNPGLPSASLKAFALSNLSAGNFSSARPTAAETFDGTVLRRTVTGGAGKSWIIVFYNSASSSGDIFFSAEITYQPV